VTDADAGPLVALGELGRPHGLRGEVRVTPLTDDPARLAGLRECIVWDVARDARERRRVRSARRHGEAVVVALEGVDTPEAAGALVGRLLALPRAEARPLPPGQFYPWQLTGCEVRSEAGEALGVVTRIEASGAQDLWVVEHAGREHLVPAVPEIVQEVDLAARRVTIRPPAGLLEL
jgi:16S rRNA processing protein RimM